MGPSDTGWCMRCGDYIGDGTHLQADGSMLCVGSDVRHPSHYQIPGLNLELMDIIDALDLNRYETMIVQYVIRSRRKGRRDPLRDLQKALWYLNREVDRLLRARQKP